MSLRPANNLEFQITSNACHSSFACEEHEETLGTASPVRVSRALQRRELRWDLDSSASKAQTLSLS